LADGKGDTDNADREEECDTELDKGLVKELDEELGPELGAGDAAMEATMEGDALGSDMVCMEPRLGPRFTVTGKGMVSSCKAPSIAVRTKSAVLSETGPFSTSNTISS